ncbi:MAG: DUF4968 domain-containing protein, partial [Cytophagia bacterium]|nr:DUF4968 domain-containing protein [Cytophagia bacterium]
MNFKNESIGSISSFQWKEGGIEGIAGNKRFAITFYNDRICRVQASLDQEFEHYPFSVILEPQKTCIDGKENDQSLTLKSDHLKVEIQRSPFRISFKNNEGANLNEDDPAFGISWQGHKVTNYKSLAKDEIFLGMGEKGGGLNRRGASYDNWNSDAFGFDNWTDPLYMSTPFYIGVREGKPYGIFLDNTFKSHFNFGASNNDRFSYFSAEAGDLNYYFIQGDTVAQVIQEYAKLTGTCELPPKWSLGFQQCRYSYYPDHEVYNIADTFRKKKIPA